MEKWFRIQILPIVQNEIKKCTSAVMNCHVFVKTDKCLEPVASKADVFRPCGLKRVAGCPLILHCVTIPDMGILRMGTGKTSVVSVKRIVISKRLLDHMADREESRDKVSSLGY
ncbi:MAG: hypothetical protein WC799_13555 [Desulfobacteraceae bacterium]